VRFFPSFLCNIGENSIPGSVAVSGWASPTGIDANYPSCPSRVNPKSFDPKVINGILKLSIGGRCPLCLLVNENISLERTKISQH
jgi:hypothetical protein